MDISEVLNQVGLNEKEASVYLALLELGTATVHPIASKANIKRPTTYLILEDLQRKGMVSVIPREKKVMYTAESPEKLTTDLNKKQELLKRFMPNMMAVFNAKIDKPGVLLFEGKEAVRGVYEKILAAKEVEFFSTIRDIISVYPDYPKKLNSKAMSCKVLVRELLTRSEADLNYAKTMEHGQNFMQRFAPGQGEFLTDNCLYDGNVVFFSFQPYIFAVQIKSKGIYQSLRNLFEYAWQAAEPYEKVLEKEKPA
jgi:HTH-type transcriptional regulator, sugar sensing transcriptional regulator